MVSFPFWCCWETFRPLFNELMLLVSSSAGRLPPVEARLNGAPELQWPMEGLICRNSAINFTSKVDLVEWLIIKNNRGASSMTRKCTCEAKSSTVNAKLMAVEI